MTLRNPIPGDIGWLISMHGKFYAEQFGFDAAFERDIAKKVIAFLERTDPFNTLWIATANDAPIGSIAVSRRADQTAFINFLLVTPEYRGQGLAKTLMDTVISHCHGHNIDTVCLETYSCLKAARKLYEQYDFAISTKNVAIDMYGQTFDQEFWQKRLHD